jgi:branched-chain amino acid aminotransferase
LPGITRQTVIDICQSNNIPIIEKDISVTEMYNADEVFSTGTMGELARVEEIDKRKIENKGDILSNLQDLFRKLTEKDGENIPS